jgi:hypothetical protein
MGSRKRGDFANDPQREVVSPLNDHGRVGWTLLCPPRQASLSIRGKLPQGEADLFIRRPEPPGSGLGFGRRHSRKDLWSSRLPPIPCGMSASPAHRRPMLLLRLTGSLLLRFDTRAFLELLSHEPPRNASALLHGKDSTFDSPMGGKFGRKS